MEGIDEKTAEEINELYDGKESSFLVFSIKNHRYVFKSALIQEIVYGAKIHAIPFTPDYIEGVLNCRGNPFTVINVPKMDKEADNEITERIFLLFKRADDNFCIHISNIELFFEPEEDDVYEDKVKYKSEFIPLFDADRIEEKLCEDLGKDE